MGSFSQDPIGFAAGDANLYRYVGNGPVDSTDPSGLEGWIPFPKTNDGNTINPATGRPVGQPSPPLDAFHYEGRERLNSDLPPTPDEAFSDNSWEELPEAMSIYHNNGIGKPERKFINCDGREVVYDGDSGRIITEPKLKGTYNYVNPSNPKSVSDWPEFCFRGLGHFLLDMVPYYIGGNSRDKE